MREPTVISKRDSVGYSTSDGTPDADAAAASAVHIHGDVCDVFARSSCPARSRVQAMLHILRVLKH